MIEFKNLQQVADYFEVDIEEVEMEYYEYMGNPYIMINGYEIQNPYTSQYGELVLVDLESDSDCKEYIIKWEINNYDWFMLNNGKLIKVEISDIYNERMEYISGRGVDELGNKVCANCEYAPLMECIKKDNCLYFIEKDEENNKE